MIDTRSTAHITHRESGSPCTSTVNTLRVHQSMCLFIQAREQRWRRKGKCSTWRRRRCSFFSSFRFIHSFFFIIIIASIAIFVHIIISSLILTDVNVNVCVCVRHFWRAVRLLRTTISPYFFLSLSLSFAGHGYGSSHGMLINIKSIKRLTAISGKIKRQFLIPHRSYQIKQMSYHENVINYFFPSPNVDFLFNGIIW